MQPIEGVDRHAIHDGDAASLLAREGQERDTPLNEMRFAPGQHRVDLVKVTMMKALVLLPGVERIGDQMRYPADTHLRLQTQLSKSGPRRARAVARRVTASLLLGGHFFGRVTRARFQKLERPPSDDLQITPVVNGGRAKRAGLDGGVYRRTAHAEDMCKLAWRVNGLWFDAGDFG